MTAGNLREELRRGLQPQLSSELWGGDGWRTTRQARLRRREVTRLGGPAVHDWQPWPLRVR